MKFLKWLFNINKRHGVDMRRYEKGKIGTKILAIVLMFALVGATVGIEYWCINLFNVNLGYGILVLIFLLLPFIAVTLEYCELYAYLGFKMFFWGSVAKIAEKIDENHKNKTNEETQIDQTNTEEIKPEILQTEKTQPSHERKSHFWLDLVVGILGAVLAIVTVLAIVLLATR